MVGSSGGDQNGIWLSDGLTIKHQERPWVFAHRVVRGRPGDSGVLDGFLTNGGGLHLQVWLGINAWSLD